MRIIIIKYLQLFLLFTLFLIVFQASAQKNDTLYFLNGDRISGEIKQYKFGFLTYKTYGVSTVKVKYDKINTFFSRKNFEIILKDGRRRYGSFDTSNLKQFVNIVITNDTILTPLIEIVEIIPIKNTFFKRLDGNVEIGYSYKKATSISQLTFSGDMKYTHRNYFSELKANSNYTQQQEQDDTKKNDANLSYYRRLKKNWFGAGAIGGEQNTELGLDLRIQAGLGLGNEIIHTNSNNLLASAGFVVNQEWSADTTATRQNIDAYASLSYRLFRFKDPEIDITSNFSAFPSFTVKDRWRINYDIKIKIEIITDFYFSLSYYINYDSKPTSETASKDDYSIITSIGYTF
ncbi:MAG: hypothetical protein B6D61_07565 [Bacteroidetes bacterium 4484_249]|nr:MAG: hypothetical protein B6D61_07565 [Bacteroidetes bacterium 4484_249]